MNRDTIRESLAALEGCQSSYLAWRLAIENNAPAEFETMQWAWYVKSCIEYKRCTGREYMPVLWGAS
jgi:hypothetical protein